MPPSRGPFAALYVLAMCGAFIAFIPLGMLILPQKIATIAGIDSGGGPVRTLSWLLVAGGIMAGFSNIAAGHVSDRLFRTHGNRRRLIGLGLMLVIGALAVLGAAQSFAGLVLAMLIFQLAINMLLSPLVALMVDYVPDRQKGAIAGWLGLALPVGSLSVTLLAALGSLGPGGQLAVMIMLVVVLVAPLLLRWPIPAPVAPLNPAHQEGPSAQHAGTMRNFALAWMARLLVQFSAAAILPYLYYFVAEVARPGETPARTAAAVGTMAVVFAVASIGGGLGAGWLSDRLGRRQPVLVATALMVALAMILLATLSDWTLIILAYALFAAGLAGFLAVDSALVAQLVSASDRRATLLGIMNLTNTLPGFLAPAATLLAIGDGVGAGAMVAVLKLAAAGAAIAALCGSQIRIPRDAAGDAGVTRIE